MNGYSLNRNTVKSRKFNILLDYTVIKTFSGDGEPFS